MTRTEAEEILLEENPSALFADGFDDAIIGIARRCGQPALVVYESEKCIEILAKTMSYEDAEEFFSFNTLGAWFGEHTPMFLFSAGIEQ